MDGDQNPATLHRNATIGTIVVLVLIIAGMFIFAYLKRSEMNAQPTPSPAATSTHVAGPYDSITRIDAKHFYSDGTHTLAGTINMPTPCDLIDATSTASGSTTRDVTVAFKIINNSTECEARVTAQRFKVSFDASEHATINATLNGRPVELNLIPAAPGETPDNFELYLKG